MNVNVLKNETDDVEWFEYDLNDDQAVFLRTFPFEPIADIFWNFSFNSYRQS